MRWYERQDRSPDIVARWLAAAEEHLPAAVPQRFGDSEPLRGRWGRDDLATAYARADHLFFLAGTPPVYHASLAAGRPRFYGPTWAHTMSIELPPDDQRVRRFALATGAVRWQRGLADDVNRPPAVGAGLVVVADRGGTVTALDAGSGQSRWTADLVASGLLVLAMTGVMERYCLRRAGGLASLTGSRYSSWIWTAGVPAVTANDRICTPLGSDSALSAIVANASISLG